MAPEASVPLTLVKVGLPHRCDDSQVGKMAAPCTGMVTEHYITRMEVGS